MHRRPSTWRYIFVSGLGFAFPSLASADRVNVTVDDSSSDIVYGPLSAWNVGNDCSACTAHPDPSMTHGGTWHDVSFPPDGTAQDLRTASLEFTGSALYVFCIISQSLDHPFGTSDMTFFIDGNAVGRYTSVPNGDKTYQYNVPVYANDSVGAGSHSFTVTNGTPGGPETLLLLDYIIYSQDIEPTSTSPPATAPPPVSLPPVSPPSDSPTQVSLPRPSSGPSGTTIALKPPTPSKSLNTGVVQSFLSSSPFSIITITQSSGATVTTVLPSNGSPSALSPDSQLPSSSSHTRIAIIAASVSGCIVLVLVLLAVFLCCRRKCSRKSHRANTPIATVIETTAATQQLPRGYAEASSRNMDVPQSMHNVSHSAVGAHTFLNEGDWSSQDNLSEASPFADTTTDPFSPARSGPVESVTFNPLDETQPRSSTLYTDMTATTLCTSHPSDSRVSSKQSIATSRTHTLSSLTQRRTSCLSSPTFVLSSVSGEDPPPAYQA